MNKLKVHLFFGLCLFFGESLHAQQKIQDLNALLDQSGGKTNFSKSTLKNNQEQSNNPELLKETFFDAHGMIAVVNGKDAVKWDRVDKPVQDMDLKSVSEIPTLKAAYPDQIYLIRTIRITYSNNMDPVAELATDMPNLQNILITSYKEMPEDIDEQFANFLSKLQRSQINPVNVYYYQEAQPQ